MDPSPEEAALSTHSKRGFSRLRAKQGSTSLLLASLLIPDQISEGAQPYNDQQRNPICLARGLTDLIGAEARGADPVRVVFVGETPICQNFTDPSSDVVIMGDGKTEVISSLCPTKF